jgi:small GTP-binding protein
MQDEIIVKFCIVGESSVGKTSLLHQYILKKFKGDIKATIGCDFSTKMKFNIKGKSVRLQIWDIAGG